MNRSFIIMLSVLSFFLCSASCDKHKPANADTSNAQSNGNNNDDTTNNNQMKITVGSTVFTATLYDNETVTALKAMLPLTLNMTDLNANEKYYHFSTNLPANAQSIGTIQTGDLMLYGSNSFVLFYKTFNTSYTYTRIGKTNNISGLATALGMGGVTVKFELD